MQLEEGKFYKTRDGRKVGPMGYSPYEGFLPWEDEVIGDLWDDDGTSDSGDNDLIAKWTDEPETLAVSRVEFENGTARVYLSNGAELSGVIHTEADASAGDITRAGLVVKVG